ncbi:MAG: polysaccharide deacetylase family protein [Clostridium sp.]
MRVKSRIIVLVILFLILGNLWGIDCLAAELDEKKTVYLTFDDGPSLNTDDILAILNEKQVVASFFIIGDLADKNEKIFNLICESKMDIFPHTYSHDYSKIYTDLNAYYTDLMRCSELIKYKNSGEYTFIRLPGGTGNENLPKSLKNEILSKVPGEKCYFIDWTVDSGDTMRAVVDSSEIKSNISKYSGERKVEVVLMHDLLTKKSTVQSLSWIIDYYKERGYEFKLLSQITEEEIQYLKSIDVIK